MLHTSRNLSKKLNQVPLFYAGFGKQQKPTSRDLEKYDVIFIGGNLAGMASRQFEKETHKKYKVMSIFDQSINQIYPLRCTYEQGRVSKSDYLINSKLSIESHTAFNEGPVVKFDPENNKITLKNGRVIQYEQLVIGMGMQHDVDAIKGLEDAWRDPDVPVYVNKDHPKWRGDEHKYSKYHYNFTSGQTYFNIPPYPFAGEVECYNFFISDEVWGWYKANGKQHPNASLTVINANDRFVQYNDSADKFIKDELAKRKIPVVYGENLVAINSEKREAQWKNLQSGDLITRAFHNLYSILPCKPHESLVNAGLTASNGLLDVDRKTLRHNKYKNIFGIGDVCNVPTTKTWWAGWYQLHVIRNNVYRSLKGQQLNGVYEGETKVPLIMGQSTLTYVSHYYDNVDAWQHLKFTSGPIARQRYYHWGKSMRKKFLNFYLGKTWGPPYFKLKKTFPEIPGTPEAEVSTFDKYFGKYFPKKKEGADAQAH